MTKYVTVIEKLMFYKFNNKENFGCVSQPPSVDY